MEERIVYKIDDPDSSHQINFLLSNLKITDILPIHDTSKNNKLIVNKLAIDDKSKQFKLFIETSNLQVIEIEDNKLHLKLPQSHIDFFNLIDDKCTELLSDLINGESELDISELYSNIDLIGYENIDNFDSSNIEYKSLISPDNTDIIKINIFSGTTIKQGNKEIEKSKIVIGDNLRLVIGLDYISLLIDKPNLIARTKIYCYLIDLNKKYVQQPREKINNWVFSSNNNSDVFIKTNTTNDDNFYVNTEICVNNNYDNHKNMNTQSVMEKISESSDTFNFSDSDNSQVSNLLTPENKDINNIQNSIKIEENSVISETSDTCNFIENDNNMSDYKNISDSENIKILSSLINNNLDDIVKDEIVKVDTIMVSQQDNDLNEKNKKTPKTKTTKMTKTPKTPKTTKEKNKDKTKYGNKNITIENNNYIDSDQKNIENNEIDKVENNIIELESKVKSTNKKKPQLKQKIEKINKKTEIKTKTLKN
jgi:hypothetical protein